MIKILLILLLISTPSFASGWYSTLQGTASDVEQSPPPNGVTIAYNTTDNEWEFNYGLAPAGGTTGTCLEKNSGSDYDYSWVSCSGGGSSQWTGTNPIYFNGNVGINTATPQANLHIGESANANQFRVDNPSRIGAPFISDINWNSVDIIGNGNGTDQYLGQIFVLTSTTIISGASYAALGTTGTPTGTWTVSIQTVSGGVPTGTLAAAGLINSSYTPSIVAIANVNFNTPTSLPAGTYAVVFQDNTPQSFGNYWPVGLDSTGGYAAGSEVINTGSWSVNTGQNLAFQILGYPPGATQFPVVIDNSGNVGINTTSPTSLFDVEFPLTGDSLKISDSTFFLAGVEFATLPTFTPYYAQGNTGPAPQTVMLFQGGLFLKGGALNGDYINGSPNLVFLSNDGLALNKFTFGDGEFGGSADTSNLWYENSLNVQHYIEFASPFTTGCSLIVADSTYALAGSGLNPATCDGHSALQIEGESDFHGIVTTNNNTLDDGSGNIIVPSLQASSGVRYVCVNTSGQLVSQATACVGT